ncbi:MAG: flagellar hook assembly protein FlgD [Rhodospirillales bacterium]|jgi:flagellar basal-body rod modification protein FlgD
MSTSLASAQTASSATSTSSTAAKGTAAASRATFGNNYDTFLKLLTSQLQNQNPLSPMDSTQFTSQLVQYSSVEQAIKQNENLEKLIAMQSSTQSANAVGYIGKSVDMSGERVGLVNGKGKVTYSLPQAAGRVLINIYDSSNKLAARLEGDTGAGSQIVQWNGRSDTGAQLPDGDYRVEVSAQNAAGAALTVDKKISGTVTAVDYTGNTVMLTVNGTKLPLSQLATVYGTASN